MAARGRLLIVGACDMCRRVSIPQVLASNSTNTPSPFPFVISNVGGKNDAGRKKTDSVVVLCAPTNDIRRKWMEYLKSHMVRFRL